ncbi:MAG: PAS domain S-box protein [Desulfatibacillum sp.]|nr:PAS domain S-box protein [Desulfatibacillum sp.]
MEGKPTENDYHALLGNLELETRKRVKAETALQEAEAKLNHAFASFPAGIYEIDFTTGKFSNVNEAMCGYCGYSREEFKGLSPQDLLTPESQALYEQRVRDFFSGKQITPTVCYTIRRKDGQELVCLLNNQFLYKDGIPVGATVIIRDITAEWNTQKTLRCQAMALEQSFDGIALFSREDEAIFINQAWAEMHGYETTDELIGKKIGVFHSRDQYEKLVLPAMLDPENDGASNLRIFHIRQNGEQFPTRMSTSIIKDDKGQPTAILAIAQDITEQLRMEECLRQSQKMEAIGTLAGGIAHDFNNILYPIMGYAELALEDIHPHNPAAEYVREIVHATERAKSLVAQILSFSKPSEEKQRPIKLPAIVDEALHLIRATLPSTIEIQEDIQAGTGLIIGNATQVHQVLMNLCTNSYHAMKDSGGVLRVSLEKKILDSDDLPPSSRMAPGQYLQLQITDTGTGMEPHVASRIFEPYFTTKPQGEGSGMGLAMVHSIMGKHGGDILVDTNFGQGTTFTLYFPLLEMKGSFSKRIEAVQNIRGNERILLVDDEVSIIKMLGMALERLGYQVHAFDNSLDALEAFRKHPDNYDLAVVDMTMPFMTGDVLAHHMKQIRPDVKFVLCTGYSRKLSDAQASELGAFKLLKKPLSTKTLASTIRQALDGCKG